MMRCASNPSGTLHPPNPLNPCYDYGVIKTKQMISLPTVQQELTVENYRQQLDVPYISAIDNRIVENYALDDMIDFINQYGADNFYNLYEEYVETAEDHSYGAVDAFIEEFGIHTFNASAFQDAYRGQWDSKAQYAENYVTDCYSVELPGFVEIDWEASFDNMDEVFTQDGYVFNTQF
jgi:hypothetical protein